MANDDVLDGEEYKLLVEDGANGYKAYKGTLGALREQFAADGIDCGSVRTLNALINMLYGDDRWQTLVVHVVGRNLDSGKTFKMWETAWAAQQTGDVAGDTEVDGEWHILEKRDTVGNSERIEGTLSELKERFSVALKNEGQDPADIYDLVTVLNKHCNSNGIYYASVVEMTDLEKMVAEERIHGYGLSAQDFAAHCISGWVKRHKQGLEGQYVVTLYNEHGYPIMSLGYDDFRAAQEAATALLYVGGVSNADIRLGERNTRGAMTKKDREWYLLHMKEQDL